MALVATFVKKTFNFNFKARTSRGLMRDKISWFIRISDETNANIFGVGECGPLSGLSIDFNPHFENALAEFIKIFNERLYEIEDEIRVSDFVLPDFSSITFGFETALLDLKNGGKRIIYQNSFLESNPIPINGLIWMGDMDFMMSQISKKIGDGFSCIKLKVGGLDFDRECDVLDYIRKRFFREDITIRLDANGAFKVDDVLFRLEQLEKYKIHSIEQPIKPGLDEMEELCRKSPIPVSFDEELKFYAIDLKVDNLAVPKFGNEAMDTALAQFFQNNYPLKYKLTEAGTPEPELRRQGFNYVLCYVHTRGKAAREILGYDMTKDGNSYASITFPDGGVQLKTISADKEIYKFYFRHIDNGNVFLGTKWDADVNWLDALRNHVLAFKNEARIP